jgi:large subunit ribosomal protein L25
MKSIDVKGTARTETGKKACRDIRKAGAVPCNLYGEAKKDGKPVAQSFTATQEELRKLVYSPDIYSVNLNIDGKEYKAIMKELQFHPVTDKLLHIDFYEITETKPIVMEVPIKLNGLAEGVKAGGKLSANVRKLKVRAPYTAIPEQLNIDVTGLGLGKTVKVADLSFEGLELVTSPSVVVCQVKMTRSAMSAASKGDDGSDGAAE